MASCCKKNAPIIPKQEYILPLLIWGATVQNNYHCASIIGTSLHSSSYDNNPGIQCNIM